MSRTIKIHKKERCSTADYWAALLGFKEFFTIDSKASNVPQVMAHLALKENELDPQPCRVFNLENNLIAVNLLNNDRIIDNFPMLENGFILRTETEAIYEWNETEELAAQIRAKGLGKYALEYFASDYSYRKEQYQKERDLTLSLSAFIYQITITEEIPNASENFTAFLPHLEYAGRSLYQFIAEVMDIYTIQHSFLPIGGYILTLRLSGVQEEEDYLAIKCFLHRGNSSTSPLKKGMKVSGVFWMQGMIVDQ